LKNKQKASFFYINNCDGFSSFFQAFPFWLLDWKIAVALYHHCHLKILGMQWLGGFLGRELVLKYSR
jgi:hypothetical protein